MKAPLRIAALSLSWSLLVPGLVACTSSMDKSTYVEPARVMQPGEVRVERDAAYIAYVERTARRRGILVQWVNPPTKRIVAAQQ